jgi:glycosyltransferase involved in cell wall biosynthesis
VIVVGQTPPPYGGQAVMIDQLLRGALPSVRLRHVRMAFSTEMDQVGKFGFGKLLELLRVIAAIVLARFRHRATVLYYPPGGANRLPLLRDFAILIATRWLFRRTVFHFHASGLGARQRELPALLRPFFRLAYYGADAGIRLSELAPDDPRRLRARAEYVVPNGIEDDAVSFLDREERRAGPLRLLFVGLLCESKGVEVLVEACRQLRRRGVDFRLELVGRFESPAYERRVRGAIDEAGLADRIELPGVVTGRAKLERFAAADVFCFPTFFEAETFSVVLVEALSFGLPVVTTRWRGIPSIVDEGEQGFLVPVRDPAALADGIARLAERPQLRREMGRRGRRKFLEEFTAERYRQRLDRILAEVAAGRAPQESAGRRDEGAGERLGSAAGLAGDTRTR